MTERDRADRDADERDVAEGSADDLDADDLDADDPDADDPGDDGRGDGHRRRSGQGNRRRRAVAPEITAAQAGRLGMEQIAELTGKDPESVIGVEPAEDGWRVTVEVIEDRRIPSSTDILSAYETDLTADGDLISYRRQRRYARGHGDMARG